MKRKQLVRTAGDLFFKYGIKRVTVEEICREANVSKMTFYKYFKNKNELVKSMMIDMTDEALDKYRVLMESDILFEDKVRKMIEMKVEGTEQMSQEFFNDYLPHAEPGMIEFVTEQSRATMELIVEDFRKAQQKGEIRKDIKIEFILWYLNQMIDLMADENLEKIYVTPGEMISEMVNFFFYGIMPRK